MGKPVIVEAVRTPIGKRGGRLSGVHPSLLLGSLQRALLERCALDPKEVGGVVGGCATQVGEQGFNVTRMAWLAAGLPYEVAGTTLDCQCGSSLQASNTVHNLIAVGAIDCGIACGVEVMSRVPLGSATLNGPGRVKPRGFPYDLPDQFVAAERIARKRGFTRADVDALGVESQGRAARAIAEGRFEREIIAVEVPGGDAGDPVRLDEGPRPTTLEGLERLEPVVEGGVHTAGTTSQISDGASAVLWMDEDKARSVGLQPRARLRGQAFVGTDPYFHIEGPIDATTAVLDHAGMTLADIDRFEINEAFAAVVLAWAQVHGAGRARLNVNGGAIALGHPMGATGGRLIATALHELERAGQGTALLAMCCGTAVAPAAILERA